MLKVRLDEEGGEGEKDIFRVGGRGCGAPVEKQPVDDEVDVNAEGGYMEGVEGGGVAPGDLFSGFLRHCGGTRDGICLSHDVD